jgi:hypothetical protein
MCAGDIGKPKDAAGGSGVKFGYTKQKMEQDMRAKV